MLSRLNFFPNLCTGRRETLRWSRKQSVFFPVKLIKLYKIGNFSVSCLFSGTNRSHKWLQEASKQGTHFQTIQLLLADFEPPIAWGFNKKKTITLKRYSDCITKLVIPCIYSGKKMYAVVSQSALLGTLYFFKTDAGIKWNPKKIKKTGVLPTILLYFACSLA